MEDTLLKKIKQLLDIAKEAIINEDYKTAEKNYKLVLFLDEDNEEANKGLRLLEDRLFVDSSQENVISRENNSTQNVDDSSINDVDLFDDDNESDDDVDLFDDDNESDDDIDLFSEEKNIEEKANKKVEKQNGDLDLFDDFDVSLPIYKKEKKERTKKGILRTLFAGMGVASAIFVSYCLLLYSNPFEFFMPSEYQMSYFMMTIIYYCILLIAFIAGTIIVWQEWSKFRKTNEKPSPLFAKSINRGLLLMIIAITAFVLLELLFLGFKTNMVIMIVILGLFIIPVSIISLVFTFSTKDQKVPTRLVKTLHLTMGIINMIFLALCIIKAINVLS